MKVLRLLSIKKKPIKSEDLLTKAFRFYLVGSKQYNELKIQG